MCSECRTDDMPLTHTQRCITGDLKVLSCGPILITMLSACNILEHLDVFSYVEVKE